jgi:ATP-binding cassette subfamily A (ABC1) protein 3
MTVSFFINFLLGSLGAIVIMVLRLIDSTRSTGLALQWLLRIFPAFSFGYGFINIGNLSIWSILAGLPNGELLSVFDRNVAGGDILFLGIFGFIYFIILFIVEFVIGRGSLLAKFSREDKIPFTSKP